MNKNRITVKAPAKINLTLRVTGKRKDGYHNIATLFQMVSLFDTLTFTPRRDGEIKIVSKNMEIPEKENLVYKAALSLRKKGMPGVKIEVAKRIPSGAGLGGGSSDAAATLCVLNRMWGLNYGPNRLRSFGKKLGADVPFFLTSPTAWGTGIGDRLTPLPGPRGPFHILLVKPEVNIPTPAIYRGFSDGLTGKLQRTTIPQTFKGHISVEDTVPFLRNDLERTVIRLHPEVGKVKDLLAGLHSKGVMVTGSGATVFALFKDRKTTGSALKKIRKEGLWAVPVIPLSTMEHLRGFC